MKDILVSCNRESEKTYPNKPNSRAALYWRGISINAARAKAVSFSADDVFFDMISVKLTNCKFTRLQKILLTSGWLY